MKVAKKVVFLLDGGDGLCSVIYGGLHPNPSSNFQTRSDSFELSLERYGIEDRRASGEILHHVNANGFLECKFVRLYTMLESI
ncbi:uncharacterized protein [Henckelia pumila]|uniref:uncharacterized protein isoform X2 n=1 Tax=Henckelia pumila TaxID=405737 RepID=UPI003C6DDC62